MAEFLQKILGGAKSVVSQVTADVDNDFADFATAASPVPLSHVASEAVANTAATSTPLSRVVLTTTGRPYTKWYRVWERVTVADFYQEFFILPTLLLIILVNLWGSYANRSRAKKWAANHYPLLESEYALVGRHRSISSEDALATALKRAQAGDAKVPENILKEKSKSEYTVYCSGRKNVACLDVKVTLLPRYNPITWFGEQLISFFVDSWPAPVERVEATATCFDGKEKSLVPAQAEKSGGGGGSTFDGFVWAVVHKDFMKKLRDDRYDVSLTTTKDHPKLPAWSTVMSESAEVTDALLTPEFIKIITDAGEDLEALIISDQPIDAPRKLNDLVPKKRVYLSMRLSDKPAAIALFAAFLRLPDHLVSVGHFRSEALRRIKATREEETRKLRKIDEDEKAEERKLQSDKLKKEERERKLGRMSDAEQRKFLEKEREKSQKKNQKKATMRG